MSYNVTDIIDYFIWLHNDKQNNCRHCDRQYRLKMSSQTYTDCITSDYELFRCSSLSLRKLSAMTTFAETIWWHLNNESLVTENLILSYYKGTITSAIYDNIYEKYDWHNIRMYATTCDALSPKAKFLLSSVYDTMINMSCHRVIDLILLSNAIKAAVERNACILDKRLYKYDNIDMTYDDFEHAYNEFLAKSI